MEQTQNGPFWKRVFIIIFGAFITVSPSSLKFIHPVVAVLFTFMGFSDNRVSSKSEDQVLKYEIYPFRYFRFILKVSNRFWKHGTEYK